MSWAARFRFRQFLKNSLWPAPLVAGLAGLALAEVIQWLDSQGDLAVLQYSPETATAVPAAWRGVGRSPRKAPLPSATATGVRMRRRLTALAGRTPRYGPTTRSR